MLIAAVDNLGLCLFTTFCLGDPKNFGFLCEMLSAKFDGEWTPERVLGIGQTTLRLEKKYNEAAGFTAEDDKLPVFMYEEQLTPINTVFDITDEELAQVSSGW